MDCPLKPGDRVRVTCRNRMCGYQPGDKGTVLSEVTAGPSGTCYYVVAMDKAGGGRHHGHLRRRRDRAGRLSHCHQADSYRLGVPEASASRIARYRSSNRSYF